MKFYQERKDGRIEVLAVQVSQSTRWDTRGNGARTPRMAEAIARKGGFLKKSDFGDARLERARAAGLLMEPQRVKGAA